MTWVERKKWFAKEERPRKLEKSYSVTEAARIMGVSRQTVFKWLSINEPEGAVIPPTAWWRTPAGYIMIKEWILLKLQNE